MESIEAVTVEVPFTIRKRGGRKQVITPDGASASIAPRARIDSTMIKAIARGFRWRKLLESGAYNTVGEIAAAERINPSYASRVLRLTLLPPDIVEAILNGRQPSVLNLDRLLKPFPADWLAQQRTIWDDDEAGAG